VKSALLPLFAAIVLAQTSEAPPTFEMADVHVSLKAQNQFQRISGPRGGRFEMRTATMVDLVRWAYEVDSADKVVGGPNWLEMDRFDVYAKVPDKTTIAEVRPMLRALLGERFQLAVHKEDRPMPVYVLATGKKPQMKQAEGSEEPGCKPETGGPQVEGGMRLNFNMNGVSSVLNLGPGMTIQFHCRNMTMAAFAGGLRGMMFSTLNSPVQDETGLKGKYNFDLRWSAPIFGPMNQGGDRITMAEAIEKQLGLKLEERQVPTSVVVVDKVNQTPAPSDPGVAAKLAPPPPPTEFEVATVKQADPNSRTRNFGTRPGGRLSVQAMTLRFLVQRAFNINSPDGIVGLPPWADTELYDINAKAPETDANAPPPDPVTLAPMVRALLMERLGMKYHTEERPMQAYSLVPGKPKMKRADPNSRTSCKFPPPSPSTPQGSRQLICQNVTMAQFGERLQNQARELTWPVLDATGLEGGWDFTLTWSTAAGMAVPVRIGGDGSPPPGAPMAGGGAPMPASDPSGGITIFAAIEKQLGLKLEMQKRNVPVIVVDHIEQKPTEN
jgi:uncharacterized protein (TIGR03435 family)